MRKTVSIVLVAGVLAAGVGLAVWRPLCYAIIFGLLASTVTALVVVPCLYYLLTRKTTHAEPVSA